MENWTAFYEKIELTEQEKEAAILEAKIKKFRRDKHGPYWKEQEEKTLKQGDKVEQL